MATLFLTLLFISYITLGLPDSSWGTAWPFMRADLGMPLASAGIFSVVIMLCSALSSLFAPKITDKIGTGLMIACCSFLTGASILAISFVPNFYVIVALGVVLGVAGGGVDVSVNNFVADHYSSRIMNWVHAAWGLGSMLGPIILTAAINAFGNWRNGFQTLAVIQLLCTAILFLTLPMWKKHSPPLLPKTDDEPRSAHNFKLKSFAIFLSVAVYFFYAGIEISFGYWLNSLLIEGRGFSKMLGGMCVSVYYGAIMCGRIFMGLFANKLGNKTTMYIGLVVAVVGAGIFFISTSVPASFIAAVLVGFGLGPIYPCNMHETRARFIGKDAKKVVGLQVAFACVGGLAIQPLVGVILQFAGLHYLPICCAVIIAILTACIVLLNIVTRKPNPMPPSSAKSV